MEQSGRQARTRGGHGAWMFLTNHAHVLICIVREPDIRIRDIADRVGITERATHNIVVDLVEAGYLSRTRIGRRSHYHIHPEFPLRHPVERDHTVAELLDLLAGQQPGEPPQPRAAPGRSEEPQPGSETGAPGTR